MQYERFEGSWFLKSNWHLVKTGQSDQSKGVPVPPQEEPPAPEDCVIDLPPPDSILKSYGENQRQKSESRSDMDMKSREKVIPELSERAAVLYHLLNNRKSRRKYTEEPLAIEELSYLLWAIEGVKENRGKFSFRTTPSGGARHPLDVYIFAHKVEGLNVGLYRYLPVEHELVLERQGDDSVALDEALNGQFWNAACVVMWAAVPYRSEWRYGKAAYKLVALDTGHSCQNLYLACESLGLGTCAIGAYDQERLDAYLGLDGEEMFAIYAAPVGHVV
ncbi:MAG TPA: SagB/ThcOx family dehydrogenase [Rectinema sp.]|jgi:SagB-type dehydrogenase family enzyme|nr:SagB/ThcOx family dehydrogenase [Rectinema sp.]HRC83194.1 SagB/ThcOx family dehydrogenase [Rectinema sp.]